MEVKIICLPSQHPVWSTDSDGWSINGMPTSRGRTRKIHPNPISEGNMQAMLNVEDQKHFLLFCPALQQEQNLLFKADRTTIVPLTLWPCYVAGLLASKLGSLKKAHFVLSLCSSPCRKKVNPLNYPSLIPWPWGALSL